MKNKLYLTLISAVAVLFSVSPALAAEGATVANVYGPLGAAIAIGLGALGGTLGQSKAVVSALDSIGRNPSASGKIFTPMVIGLALIESLVILAFVIAIQLA